LHSATVPLTLAVATSADPAGWTASLDCGTIGPEGRGVDSAPGRGVSASCWYCGRPVAGGPALLAHLVAGHGEEVHLVVDQVGRPLVRVQCPCCPLALRLALPAGRQVDIGLVGFDLLLYHLAVDHEPPLVALEPEARSGELPRSPN
jgi:hypothetical protein